MRIIVCVCVSAMDRCYRVYVGMQASTREQVQVCMCMVREKTAGGGVSFNLLLVSQLILIGVSQQGRLQ